MKLCYRIKNAIVDAWYNFRARCQRFKRGYAYTDVWDMDYWFIRTVKPMLIHLRDRGIGIPNELYIEGDNERINWENILTEMIDCLDMMDEDKVWNYLGFINYRSKTKKDYDNCYKIIEENKNRFFELFNKYFFALWD